jgi:hypothetical protein
VGRKKGLNESQIEIQVCHWLRVKGFFFWKQPNVGFFDTRVMRFRRHSSPYVKRGVPDLIVLLPGGKFCGLEIKSATGTQSVDQKSFEQSVKRVGGEYWLVRSLEEVETILGGVNHGK